MICEYPDFLSVYAQKIEDEVNEKYADIDIPESSLEELDAGWECNQRTPTDCFAEQNGRDAERADLTCRY